MNKIIETYRLGNVVVEYCKYSSRTCPYFYHLQDPSLRKSRAKWAMIDNDRIFIDIQAMFE